eukprot:CAMPEP_0118669624 /NCGR_PEP_ID=MMETSP0785-20121206/21007_1 /TAXON_ID=91992 /ORGANISM="Bolidomonas pacifica, Strain CCMP 1866" /LENGTH=243 /DNA_ID=CAMNT_0006564333 /DNA_START=491 /DNA_END=1218 /DNA_ORIENTATION=-
MLRVFRRRLKQSRTIVATVGSEASLKDWSETLNRLVEVGGGAVSTSSGGSSPLPPLWFGLNYSGRSFGSSLTSPSILPLLGRSLRPSVNLGKDMINEEDEDDEDGVDKGIKIMHDEFYKCLTTGDVSGMSEVFSSHPSPSVSTIVDLGGRLDPWEVCLKDGNRPDGLDYFGLDCVVDGDKGYTTNIERDSVGNTLLAYQEWERREVGDEDGWNLVTHETIPWVGDGGGPARGMLKSDYRGCVA